MREIVKLGLKVAVLTAAFRTQELKDKEGSHSLPHTAVARFFIYF